MLEYFPSKLILDYIWIKNEKQNYNALETYIRSHNGLGRDKIRSVQIGIWWVGEDLPQSWRPFRQSQERALSRSLRLFS
jgi:hypothetical protein